MKSRRSVNHPARESNAELDVAFESLLVGLADLALGAGLSARELQETLTRAFVRAASGRGRLRNARINQSAVAAITGLSRPNIRQALAHGSLQKTLGPADRVVQGWQVDPDFLNPSGTPRALRLVGDSIGFPALVMRYAGDISAKALLRELIRRSQIAVNHRFVRLNRLSSGLTTEKTNIYQVVCALSSVISSFAQTTTRNGSVRQVLTRDLVVGVRPGIPYRLLSRRVHDGASVFFNTVRDSASALSASPRKGANRDNRNKRIILVVADE